MHLVITERIKMSSKVNTLDPLAILESSVDSLLHLYSWTRIGERREEMEEQGVELRGKG